ncbi:hypothetical protein MICRO8M_100385 [Microbacterium sp. 8M]|nr:hypothetical protein MICRO8M_100385 [Microbacterium sp. 8M]
MASPVVRLRCWRRRSRAPHSGALDLNLQHNSGSRLRRRRQGIAERFRGRRAAARRLCGRCELAFLE